MAESSYRELAENGLWRNNPALVQLLGLCPLLAVTTTVANALGLGIATITVLVTSSLAVSLLRSVVPDTIRLAVFVIIIAATVSCTELVMQAYAFELYQILGIFLPLITTNCLILGRAESYARRNPPLPAVVDAAMMGVGIAAAMIALGALRELAGTGALFGDMHLLFGEPARQWRTQLLPGFDGFLLALLPPGAFIFTGLLIALKNGIDARRVRPVRTSAAARRIRVTGRIS